MNGIQYNKPKKGNQYKPMNTLLLVEDEQALAAVIVRELNAIGYRVSHALDGETALQAASSAPFDLVILDWMLPRMDGLEVLRHLREHSAIPVLMLTARDAEIDRVIGLEVGADDYLTKPFSMRELLARVRAMLRRRELIEQTLIADQQKDKVIEAGALRLDPLSHLVTIDDEVVDLTKTEFALLYLLLSNPMRTFSRNYLLETVWGGNYVDGDRAVDNTVLRLRKKLRNAAVSLETVWGVGYRWRCF
jgi:DNA-binding response OmpR family regulator